jgi:carboxyl-terminal processing protease
MNRGSRTLVTIAIIVLVAFGAFGLGFATPYLTGLAVPANGSNGSTAAGIPEPSLPAGSGDISQQFDDFWKTFQDINNEFYYQPINRQQMINGATKGMVSSLGDDFTAFLTPKENQAVQESMQGNFEGVGMYIEERNGVPTVEAPIPNTPAEKAGIQAGDAILAVDGRDVTQMTTDQVAALVRGTAGTQVRLSLLRPGQQTPFDVTLTRAQIDVPSVTFKMLDGGIADLQVSIFNEKTTQELDDALKQAQDQNAKGIILDLRNNGGGLVTAALQMLGRFLPENSVGFYESLKSDHSQDMPQVVISDGPKVLDTPMVVLINGGSASASEITAGALQDYGRAKLIGEQSFGKGSEQHVYTFDDGSSARVTFAHWLTPHKHDINPQQTPTPGPGTPVVLPTLTPTPLVTIAPAAATATVEAQPLISALPGRGLTPDIEVQRTVQDFEQDKDPQLARAQQYLQTGK